MESDSEEALFARFRALRADPLDVSDDSNVVRPQDSPTTPKIDRGLSSAYEYHRSPASLGGRTGSETESTEPDYTDLESLQQSDNESLYEDFVGKPRMPKPLQDSRPHSRQSRPPIRRDTITAYNHSPQPNHHSTDSDADDEGAVDDLISRLRNELEMQTHSSSSSSRDASVDPPNRVPKPDVHEEEEGSDSSDSVKPGGQRTPPSHPVKLDTSKEVGKYQGLFSALETPRALPVLTPTKEGEPLPAVFERLKSMSPATSKIRERSEDEDDGEAAYLAAVRKNGFKSDLGAPPTLDLEGFRAALDQKPEAWCSICNRDATLQCPGCDNELYCEDCFEEHLDLAAVKQEGTHKPVDYSAPLA